MTPLNLSSNQHGLIPKNNFRQLFALAAEETHARIRNDGKKKYFLLLIIIIN